MKKIIFLLLLVFIAWKFPIQEYITSFSSGECYECNVLRYYWKMLPGNKFFWHIFIGVVLGLYLIKITRANYYEAVADYEEGIDEKGNKIYIARKNTQRSIMLLACCFFGPLCLIPIAVIHFLRFLGMKGY